MKKLILILAILLFARVESSAQRHHSSFAARPDYRAQFESDSLFRGWNRYKARWSAEVNAVDLAYLGTVNGEIQFAVAQYFSILGQARYNNWTYNAGQENQFESRQRSFAAGVRFWPWYTYSGWWFETKAQYQEYNRGGIGTLQTEEGDAVGGALAAGYSLQISKWLNLDFGLGGWLGNTRYTVYACPNCGKILEEGNKFFILPNEVTIAAMFIF